MSEIRDRIVNELRSTGFGEGQINYVLGMREIAIVDREAELPEKTYTNNLKAYVLPDRELCIMSTDFNREYLEYGEAVGMEKMRKAGWIKEVKDE